MEQYKQEFIDFMKDSDVLKFGDFTLKSGRKSPFFMNAGGYVTGAQLKRLGKPMRRRSMMSTDWSSMSCSGRLTRGSPLRWPRRLPLRNFTASRCATALTGRKTRTMVRTKAGSWARSCRMATGW